jgi:hypothetical protein
MAEVSASGRVEFPESFGIKESFAKQSLHLVIETQS